MTIHTRLEVCLEQLSFEETLIRLYGREDKDRAHTRCLEAAAGFRQAFGYPAQALLSAPGRTELGGNHTDHQRGCVLAAAVDLDILAAAAVTDSGIIRVLSQGYPITEVSLRELTPQEGEKNTSAALIRGVTARMSEMGCDLRALLRGGATDEALLQSIRETIWSKPWEHHFGDNSMPATRGMYRIGG